MRAGRSRSCRLVPVRDLNQLAGPTAAYQHAAARRAGRGALVAQHRASRGLAGGHEAAAATPLYTLEEPATEPPATPPDPAGAAIAQDSATRRPEVPGP